MRVGMNVVHLLRWGYRKSSLTERSRPPQLILLSHLFSFKGYQWRSIVLALSWERYLLFIPISFDRLHGYMLFQLEGIVPLAIFVSLCTLFLSCEVSTWLTMRLTKYFCVTVEPFLVAFFTSLSAFCCSLLSFSGRLVCVISWKISVTGSRVGESVGRSRYNYRIYLPSLNIYLSLPRYFLCPQDGVQIVKERSWRMESSTRAGNTGVLNLWERTWVVGTRLWGHAGAGWSPNRYRDPHWQGSKIDINGLHKCGKIPPVP